MKEQHKKDSVPASEMPQPKATTKIMTMESLERYKNKSDAHNEATYRKKTDKYQPLTIQCGGDRVSYDGSTASYVTVTADGIGAAPAYHEHNEFGYHVAFNSLTTFRSGAVFSGGTTSFDNDDVFFDRAKVNFNTYPMDKFSRPMTNGAVMYATEGIDPNTTLDVDILTNHKNGPVSGQYYYIHTVFYSNKATNSNRAQYAMPYSANGSMYHRYYYNGNWSSWRRHVNADEKVKGIEDIERNVSKLNDDLPVIIRSGVAMIPSDSVVSDDVSIFNLHNKKEMAQMFGMNENEFFPEFCFLSVENADTKLFTGLVHTVEKAGNNKESGIMSVDVTNTGVIPDILEVAYTYVYHVPEKKCFAIGTLEQTASGRDCALVFYNRPMNNLPRVGDTFDGYHVDSVYKIDENQRYNSVSDRPWTLPKYPCLIRFKDKISPIDTSYWFNGLHLAEDIIFDSENNNLDWSKVTRCVGMFSSVSMHGHRIIIQNKNMPYLEDCSKMFSPSYAEHADGNEVVKISNCNMPNLTNASCMFLMAEQQTIDLNNNVTPKLEDVSEMFSNTSRCTIINIFDTSNVKNMSQMFYYCQRSDVRCIENLNTENVTNMFGMFNVYEAKEGILNLSSFNTKNVTNMKGMFAVEKVFSGLEINNKMPTGYIKTIYVSDNFVVDNVVDSEDMFFSCYSLVGGAGTTYDGKIVDKTYARIDNPPTKPGYFTAKKRAQVISINETDRFDFGAVELVNIIDKNGNPIDDSYFKIVSNDTYMTAYPNYRTDRQLLLNDPNYLSNKFGSDISIYDYDIVFDVSTLVDAQQDIKYPVSFTIKFLSLTPDLKVLTLQYQDTDEYEIRKCKAGNGTLTFVLLGTGAILPPPTHHQVSPVNANETSLANSLRDYYEIISHDLVDKYLSGESCFSQYRWSEYISNPEVWTNIGGLQPKLDEFINNIYGGASDKEILLIDATPINISGSNVETNENGLYDVKIGYDTFNDVFDDKYLLCSCVYSLKSQAWQIYEVCEVDYEALTIVLSTELNKYQ